MILIDQPEIFPSINIIPGLVYKDIWVTTALGILFLIGVLAVLFLRAKKKIQKESFYKIIFSLLTIFWLPLYANALYNNIYDFKENASYKQFNESGRTVLRLCNMDNRQDSGGIFCQILSFVTYAKLNLPNGSLVKLAVKQGMEPYFYYYLYPFFDFTKDIDRSEYLLVYFSDDYHLSGEKLADNHGNVMNDYVLYKMLDNGRFIMKKDK